MKKILAVSLVAIMAAGAARADIASTTYVKNKMNDLDVAEIKAENEVILSVSETDGKISATTGRITESHLDFDVATQGELDEVSSAAAAAAEAAQDAADAAQATADANATAIGTKDDQGKYTSGLGSRVESLEDEIATLSGGVGSVGTQIDNKINALDVAEIKAENEVILSVSETDGKISATTGKVTADHLNFDVATQAELDAVSSVANTAKTTANANATAIGTLSALTTDEKNSLVGAINEVDAHADAAAAAAAGAKSAADAAQGAADAAQRTADANATAIGSYNVDTGEGSGLAKSVADNAAAAQGAADAAAAAQDAADAAQGAADAAQQTAEAAQQTADDAQATADLKVNKSSLGIVEDAENPFEVPEWCKGEGVVCSFVVLDGVAGWQKVVDEDPAA